MPNDDYIKRSDAIKALYQGYERLGLIVYRVSCIEKINKIPAADVELVRHGYNVKWEYPSLFECSICGWECCDTVPGDTGIYQYCPNCGAKMDAEPPKEEEDDISRN